MPATKNYDLSQEEEIRKYWKKEKIPEKARKLNPNGEGFFMMDGPPYASGNIHLGTALNKIIKDITIRQKRMQGYSVLDQPGYDTHGLPIENKVEKKLGFKTKSEIENYGVDKFVEECRKFATEYIDIMNAEFENLGVWMDWKNPYLTLNKEYIEAIWWTFKKADEKGLLYLGKYPVHVCPHCETAVAYNEIEYTKQTDKSIYVKFKIKKEPNKFLVIWTTTPWTLPSNTGVMVHPNFDYVEAQVGNEIWIVAKQRLEQLMQAIEAGFIIIKEFKGKDIEGIEYENPLEKNLKLPKQKNAYKVILTERYVNLEDGTGLVHCAPGCGKEDYDAGTKAGLPIITTVSLDGKMTEEAGKYKGKKAREVDEEIISDLKEMNALVFKHNYTHDYPVCWRCKTPLLMIGTPQWFFKVSKIRERMIQLNETVIWQPEWGKDRFRNWLENLGDWPVSRQRYWGAPLPIWICDTCKNQKVFESEKELKEHYKGEIKDLHKPWIDEVKWKCKKCNKGIMKRVPEVLDVWFDSGVSSWGSIGYPAKKELFNKYWPAAFNVEGKDQIRGWWNSQLITSTICFDDKPFKTIAMHGMVLDIKKNKMSKSQGNIVSPQEIIQKHNRDMLRYYMAKEFKGEDMLFDWEAFKDIAKFFNTLYNSYNYASTYLELNFSNNNKLDPKKMKTEDKWIISKLNTLKKEAIKQYNKYDYAKVTELIEKFVIEELSRTYIKTIRDRAKEEKAELSGIFNEILWSITRLMAPIVPHMAEFYYLQYKGKENLESIHLQTMPSPNEKMIDKKLEKEVENAKEIIEACLSLREEQKLRLRWPLKKMIFVSKTGNEFPNTTQIIADSTNVKEFIETKTIPAGKFAKKETEKGQILLDIETDTQLKEEWELMELRRRIQEMRKTAKLNPNQIATLEISCSDKNFIEKYKNEIEKNTSTKIKYVQPNNKKTEKIIEKEFYLALQPN